MIADADASASLSSSVATWRSSVDRFLLHRDTAPADAAALAEYCGRSSIRNLRGAMLVNVACNLLWWISDPLTTVSAPEMAVGLLRWRVGAIALGLVFYAILRRLRGLERHVPATLLAIFVAFMAVDVVALWPLGGLDTPLPDAGYIVPLISAMVLVPLAQRVLLVGAIVIGWQGAYFLVEPAALESRYLGITLALMIFAGLVAVVLGHLTYHLARENYLLAARLRGFNAELRARVDDRTRELRELAHHLSDLRESERAHLARELHDHAGQLLSGIRLELDLLGMDAADEETRAGLGRVDALVGELLEGLRRILRDLRPRILDDQGLPAAIAWLAESTAEPSGLTLTLDLDDAPSELPPALATAAFRVCQEAITNVVRHADARSLWVTLRREGDALRLEVSDDGRGLEGRSQGGGFGLLGMRERALAIAGELVVERGPGGRGTSVILRAPLAPPPAIGARR